ncbi:MAG TPA: anti-sigma factor [Gaiellaceae bacterium]|nr:anti-sigma factor [Gaiellaceae bacterium]
MQLPETNCARTREAVSAQLDDELPDSELARLEAHLLVCPDCSAWAEQVGDLTARLRATSLEEPVERLVLRGSRRSWRVSSAVAVASAAAVVATMFFAPGQHRSAAERLPQVSGNVGVTAKHFTISRVTRLADGVVWPVRTSQTRLFRHV